MSRMSVKDQKLTPVLCSRWRVLSALPKAVSGVLWLSWGNGNGSHEQM